MVNKGADGYFQFEAGLKIAIIHHRIAKFRFIKVFNRSLIFIDVFFVSKVKVQWGRGFKRSFLEMLIDF
jgi:hypothetical protein